MEREALVICSDKSNKGGGISVWDLDSPDQLLHFPTCVSPPRGLLCLRNQFLVASQCHKNGSFGGGAIFIWPLIKPQPPLRSYTMETIGPICCTRNGSYLAAGSPSGNVYLWEVAKGGLLKTWRVHHKSLTCMMFSNDDSLLITGSDDGMIHVWSVISLLDVEDCGSQHSLLYCSSEHTSSVTGLLCTSSSSISIFISSSLDGTCKVWDLVTGTVLRTHVFPQPITAISIDPLEQLLCSGTSDGSIFIHNLDIGLGDISFPVSDGHSIELKGHNGCINALAFCKSGMVSGSDDGTACLWNVVTWVVNRRFNHQKGAISNLVIIPQTSLLTFENHRKVSNQSRVLFLEKYPQQPDSCKETPKFLSSSCSLRDNRRTTEFLGTGSFNQQILELEQGSTPAALQMKVEVSIEKRLLATGMTKHVMEINKHLQTRLLDIIQFRFQCHSSSDSPSIKKKRKVQIKRPSIEVEEEHMR